MIINYRGTIAGVDPENFQVDGRPCASPDGHLLTAFYHRVTNPGLGLDSHSHHNSPAPCCDGSQGRNLAIAGDDNLFSNELRPELEKKHPKP